MLFQFLSRHICRIVVVEMMIYAGDVLYVIEHFGYIMTYDDNGALPVDTTSLLSTTSFKPVKIGIVDLEETARKTLLSWPIKAARLMVNFMKKSSLIFKLIKIVSSGRRTCGCCGKVGRSDQEQVFHLWINWG